MNKNKKNKVRKLLKIEGKKKKKKKHQISHYLAEFFVLATWLITHIIRSRVI